MITAIKYPDGVVVELDFDEKIDKNGKARHKYTVLPTSEYFGVKTGATTALGVIAKPFLIQWASKMACQSIRDNCLITPGDDEPFYHVTEKDLAIAKKAHSTYKDSRADEGTSLHDLIEQHIRGNEPEVPEPLQARYEAFLRWEAKVQPEYLLDLVEKPVYSRMYDYAGKPDIPALIDGEYGIIDLKSGSPDSEYSASKHGPSGRYRAYSEHYYQCAAYDQALQEETEKIAQWYTIIYLDHQIDGEPEVGAFTTRATPYWIDAWLLTLNLSKHRKRLNEANPYI